MWKRIISPAAPRKTVASVSSPRASRWHCVSITSSVVCCDAARDLADLRFLSLQAPRLPLDGCKLGTDCRCAYQHHDDRRTKPRRSDDLAGARREGYPGHERRKQRGRRGTDSAGIYDWNG
jgi:hypothetical protein